ncbi:MAG: hypothetical protein JSW56_01645 [Deltaproteobacteria bacterium]|nr:MAG: hypothetical protein JSW56_01645 [Deltaproteobacteria bacterium]
MKRKDSVIVVVIFFLGLLLITPAGSNAVSQDELTRDKDLLRALLPKDAESPGWQAVSSPQFFEPQNLWEYINGQAEMYIDYGFQLVVTLEYRSMDGARSMAIEIFQMKNPDHAFGIYAAERSTDDRSINMGTQGYLSENVLNFWKGHYYVKLTSFQVSSNTKEILMMVASVIAANIKGTYSEPELFACFPAKNRVQMSERFIPKNFLGQSFLENGYRVEYKNGGSRYEVFLVKSASREKAKEAFAKYEDFLKSQNEKMSSSRKDDYQLIFAEREKGKAIFQYGSFVGGVLNSNDSSEAERIIEEIVRKLKRGCS